MKKPKNELKYSKDTIVKSKRFMEYRDIFNAVLEPQKMYSMEELQNIIKKFTGKHRKEM